ncbi:hypothetical protein PASE110613_15220 [Paenibacillus sediminis]|uniref:Uncharacterized protein n=1 Tax=Paenibacillus sediminis TaxID=664909 RepID=A0ABS4H467_9BACL|nr:hypothetical protein [Paenibacillus sediminis]MBP1937313.1 hypothetical protein [Paenibacillus sediminis]
MSKLKKRIISSVVAIGTLISLTPFVFAASGTYNTSYDMTGGVYSKSTWSPSGPSSFEFLMSPTIGVSGANIGIYLQKSGILGYSDVDSTQVSSTSFSDSTLHGSSAGTYRFYLRDWSGFQNTGDLTMKYSW